MQVSNLRRRLPAVGDNAAMPTESPKVDPPKRERRWFQFSLRTLMIFTMICAVATGTLATAADLSVEIERLSKDHPRSDRLDAIERLHDESKSNGAEKAIPGLSICAKDDDPVIRRRSLTALTMIAVHHKRPCPPPLVNALLDPDKDVRTVATNYVGAFDEYSHESLAVAYQALEQDDYNVRNSALEVIKIAGGKDKKALAAVKKALNDKNLMVRGNAQVAMWKLTGDHELKVRNLVERFVAPDPENIKPPISKFEITAIKLGKLGAPYGLRDMSREQPREVAAMLIKLTKDKVPSIRMGAASMLGVCFGFPDGYDETDADRAKRRLTADMGIQKALQDLRNDSDENVRSSAKAALEQLKKKEK
jgi:HEAT repeat protein